MSGAEPTDIASAQLTGLNEGVVCADVHIEASRVNESINPDNVSNVCSGYFDDGGSVANWDLGNCLGDSLNPIQAVGEGLGMVDNEVRVCEVVEMGNRMPNCNAAQQLGDGLDPANVGTELPVSMGSEAAEDGSRMPTCGNVETLGSVGEQAHMDGDGSDNGLEENGGRALTSENEGAQGESLSPEKNENHTNVSAEQGNQVLGCDVMKQSEESALYHDSHICEPPVLENSVGQECGRNELSDTKVASSMSNSVVPGLPSESLISKEGGVGLPCQLNLQSGSANPGTDTSSYALPEPCEQRLSPNKTIGEQQNQSGYENSHSQPLDEDLSTQLEDDSTVKRNPVEDSSRTIHCSGSVDDLLNKPVQTSNVAVDCTSSERVAHTSSFEQIPEILGHGNYGILQCEQSEQKEKAASEVAPDNIKEEQNTESNFNVIGSSCMDGAHKYVVEEVEKSQQGISKSSDGIEQNRFAVHEANGCPNEKSGHLSKDIIEKEHVVVLGSPAISDATEKSRRGRPRKTSAVSMEKKYPLRSSVDSTRSLHSKSEENIDTPQPSTTTLENTGACTGRKRGRKKKVERKGKSYDEYTKMKKHLQYLLHRIKYERNLLDAYSSEGWRGQSLEKLRPEKELERAKADINRSKLKIRDLFQRLDSMSTEGKFPDSLYDSEGLIDSEDIFCAKCGSKELSTGNDIILCDGNCDRGFHQFCLEPPLRTEEIPPGDQGWLCPACDCKVDCFDVLNDSQGTNLTIEDSWEKVFPEAVAAMVGNKQDDIMGLPSDDSEDNDYNPDGIDDVAEAEGSESSSDESDSSDYSSVSEDLGAIHGNEQDLGLPSDDSEDDDFDPDAANVNEDVEHESSSSDFTSASEDLGAAVNDDGTSGNDGPQLPLLEPNQDMSDPTSLFGRRHIEKLDYKKLYDETYGNATSDSSDDEEWTDMDATKKKKGSAIKGVSVSSHGDASASADGTSSVGATKRRGRKKLNQPATDSPAQLTKSPQKGSSGGKGTRRPPYNRLGEAVTQRLYESFKENQYPDRQTKENLAKELGLTPQKVDKWFGNARWSFNHHPARVEASMAAVNVACNGVESASADASTAISNHCSADSSKLDTKEGGGRKSTPKVSRKRKKTEDNQPILASSNTEAPVEATQTDTLQTPEAQHGGVQRRRRKSGA